MMPTLSAGSKPGTPGLPEFTNNSAPQSRQGRKLTLDMLRAGIGRLQHLVDELAAVETPPADWPAHTRASWERLRAERAAEAERVARRKAKAAAGARAVPVCASPAEIDRRMAGYLDHTPGAESGKGGHNHTIGVVGRAVRGFDRTPEQAYPHLAKWNYEKCLPPWTEAELWHKITDAHEHDHPSDPGPRGWLLRETPQAPVPSVEPCPPVDLSDLEGPLLEPLPYWVLRDMPGGVSAFASRENGQDQRGHTADPATDRKRLVASIVGRKPEYRPCPRAVNRLMEGCHPTTFGDDLVVRVRCKCWTCYVDRERRRWNEKRANVEFAIERGTHIFRGTTKQWEAFRRRLARAEQTVGTYRVVQAEDIVVVIAAHTPDQMPDHPGMVRVDGVAAARALVLNQARPGPSVAETTAIR
jgi:hypothetical protein